MEKILELRDFVEKLCKRLNLRGYLVVGNINNFPAPMTVGTYGQWVGVPGENNMVVLSLAYSLFRDLLAAHSEVPEENTLTMTPCTVDAFSEMPGGASLGDWVVAFVTEGPEEIDKLVALLALYFATLEPIRQGDFVSENTSAPAVLNLVSTNPEGLVGFIRLAYGLEKPEAEMIEAPGSEAMASPLPPDNCVFIEDHFNGGVMVTVDKQPVLV